MSSYSRIGVVTGANKGIGLAIVRQLALQYPKSPLCDGSFLIYLTARDQSRGEEALENLQRDAQLKRATALKADGGLVEIKFHALDVTDDTSVKTFTKYLRETHSNGIDLVINNAGIAMNGFDSNVVRTTLHCNYYSTLSVSRAFIPLLKSNARLVNVASTSGSLSKYSASVRHRFLTAKNESDVTSIMQDFQAAVDAGKEKESGYPSAAYAVSKAGLIGGTRALALELESKGSDVLVNSCCPGYVNTDMTKGNGTKAPDDGASTPVWLGLQDFERKTGSFYKEERDVEWEDL
ncbi:carbonyl reductase [Paraphoma chrysanthemicola]|nr:carbonyl reductase [Paraphoma chrysanthemicola]